MPWGVASRINRAGCRHGAAARCTAAGIPPRPAVGVARHLALVGGDGLLGDVGPAELVQQNREEDVHQHLRARPAGGRAPRSTHPTFNAPHQCTGRLPFTVSRGQCTARSSLGRAGRAIRNKIRLKWAAEDPPLLARAGTGSGVAGVRLRARERGKGRIRGSGREGGGKEVVCLRSEVERERDGGKEGR